MTYRLLILVIALLPGMAARLYAQPPTLFPALVYGKYGYIDVAGAMVIAPQFAEAGAFSEGLAAVRTLSPDSEGGYIDATGTMVIPAQFDEANAFTNGLAVVHVGGWDDEKRGGYGYIDHTGRMVIAPQFDTAEAFSDGLAKVQVGQDPGETTYHQGLFGFIDKTGAFALPPVYYDATPFAEGVAGVLPAMQPTGWRLVNRAGKTIAILPENVDYMQPFSEGLATVFVELSPGNMLFGYVDNTGAMVVEPRILATEYTYFYTGFHDGRALMLAPPQQAYITRSGAIVWQAPEYTDK